MAPGGGFGMHPVPDGGYGWFVVIGGALHTFIAGGLVRTFSLVFESIRQRYHCSASDAAWVYAINVTISLMIGPLSSALVARFGCRRVIMIGGVLFALGIIGMAYAPSLLWIYLSFGVVSGLGNGFMQVPKLISVAHWFDKRRARATSFLLMTDGFGSLCLSAFFVFAFQYYGYQGTMLIFAGITLHNCVVGALNRHPYWYDLQTGTGQQELDEVEENGTGDTVGDMSGKIKQWYKIEDDIPQGSLEDLYIPEEAIRRRTKSESAPRNHHSYGLSNGNKTPIWKSHGNLIWNKSKSTNKTIMKSENSIDNVTSGYNGLTCNANGSMLVTSSNGIDGNKADTIDECEIKDKTSCGDTVVKYVDYRLLGNPRYVVFSLLMTGCSLCFSMSNTHLAGLAREKEISPSVTAMLLGIMGILNTVTRFLSGFFFDWSFVRPRRRHLFSWAGLTIGIALMAVPFTENVISFFTVWIVYIICAAVLATQESIILSDIVSRPRFASAIGLSRFFRGFGVLIGPTLGGFLKDWSGVYTYTYIFGGVCLLTASVIFEIVTSWSGITALRHKVLGRTAAATMPDDEDVKFENGLLPNTNQAKA